MFYLLQNNIKLLFFKLVRCSVITSHESAYIECGFFIKTRKLYLKNKEIDITNFEKIYDEIKHIELIAHIEWFK